MKRIRFLILGVLFCASPWLVQAQTSSDDVPRYEVGAEFTSITKPDSFRGNTEIGLGARFTFNLNRSVALEATVRQNGHGLWTRLEYSQALGQHLRVTAAAGLIRGRADDFLGQYRRNSHATLTMRYSF